MDLTAFPSVTTDVDIWLVQPSSHQSIESHVLDEIEVAEIEGRVGKPIFKSSDFFPTINTPYRQLLMYQFRSASEWVSSLRNKINSETESKVMLGVNSLVGLSVLFLILSKN